MSDRPSPNTTTRQNSQAGPAVLFVAANGHVITANTTARALWQTGDSELIGEHFAGLFAFEITSKDPDFLESQWEVLVAACVPEPVILQAQPREGAPLPVTVRLEPAVCGQPGYIVVATPVVTSPAPAAASAVSDHGAALLAAHGAAGFFDLNFREQHIHYSPAWKKLLGYVDAELPNTYETWLQALHPDDTAAAPDKLRKKRSPGPAAFSVEFRMKHRCGHYVWIQCLGVQIVGADGTLERVTGLHLDISERKELEEASLANDDRLQALTDDDAPLAAFELDFATKTFWYSPAWRRLLGFGDGDTTEGEAAFAAVLPESAVEAGVGTFFLAPATGQTNFTEPVQLRHRDGRVLPFLLGVHRQLNRKRELVRVVGFVCPLPAPAAAPGELGGPLLTELLGTLAEGFIATDERGKVLAVNPAAARLLGLPGDQAAGQLIGDIFRLVDRQSGRPGDDAVDRVLSADGPLPLIAENALLPAGPVPAGQDEIAPLPIVWTARVARDAAGQPLGVVVVFRDPEEMNLTPEELVRSNRFESLGLLAGGIAHDFNNLLTTILGAVSLAKDSRDYGKLPDAEKACMTAKGLTKQLLAFSRKQILVPAVVNVGAHVTQSATMLRRLIGKDITLVLDAPEDGQLHVFADPNQLEQVMLSLAVNARDAMPVGGTLTIGVAAVTVTPEFAALHEVTPGPFVALRVADTGAGMTREVGERIFEPFFTTKGPGKGTGLGLAAVYGVVHQSGGTIEVTSEPGQGSCFTVYFPEVLDAPDKASAPLLNHASGSEMILLVDDDTSLRDMTARMLGSSGYRVMTARNGEDALELLRDYPAIDLVITDVVMPGMSGPDLAETLSTARPGLKVLFVSGYTDDKLGAVLRLNGAHFLPKPFTVTVLTRKVRQMLDAAAGQA